MPDSRQPYVKPVVVQLLYMADQHVSQFGNCKTTGAVSGPTPTGCLDFSNATPTSCALSGS